MFPASLLRGIVAAALFGSAFAANMVVHERRSSAPAGFAHVGAAANDQVLSMRINLAMGDRDGLEEALMQAATPGSAMFRQWLSKEEASGPDIALRSLLTPVARSSLSLRLRTRPSRR